MPRPTKDLTGQKFGRLTALHRTDRQGKGPYWLCRCDCGGEKEVVSYHLTGGKITSCGCYRSEFMRERDKTHGMSHSPTHKCWSQMIQRCTNKNATNYERYGGRDISVDPRWLKFENFLADMGEKPEGLTLERLNNSGPYSPTNCVWATPVQQANNRRSNRHVAIDGRKMTIAQASRETGRCRQWLSDRQGMELTVSEARRKRG